MWVIKLENALKFLSELELNNNRDWYHEHTKESKKTRDTFEELLQLLIFKIGGFDRDIIFKNPKDVMYRFARDTRFRKDKTPYNPALRAHITKGEKKFIPVGYFVYIRPGNRSFIASGLFPDSIKEATEMVRRYIFDNCEEWENIIYSKNFKRNFEVLGTALKNVPKNYDKFAPQSEYVKNKSWYVWSMVEDKDILDIDAFTTFAAKQFKIMKPFTDFLNDALVDFKFEEW